MITAVRQLTLSVGILALIYIILVLILHRTLRNNITRYNFIPFHIIFPLASYSTVFFIAYNYTTSSQLKKLLPIESGLIRSTLADMLSQGVGLSIIWLAIVSITIIIFDNLLYLYSKRRIPTIIIYIITLSLSISSYYSFHITLSATKTEILNHAKLMMTYFMWLEGALIVIVLMLCSLIASYYIQKIINKM